MTKSQEDEPFTIGTFAVAGEVGVETIRFYQRKELLRTPPRGSGIRRYSSEDLRRLRFIKQAQAAGFTLAEIKQLLALDAGADRERARAFAATRISALDEKIAELQRARAALQRLATACVKQRKGRCPILASFDV